MLDDRAFRAALDAMLVRVQAEARRLAVDAGHLVEAAAKRRAPVKTGTLRRSITTWGAGGLQVYAQVAPTVVYARRVELGFHGADSLGRVYNQQGKPYLKPGQHDALPGILALARTRFRAAVRG